MKIVKDQRKTKLSAMVVGKSLVMYRKIATFKKKGWMKLMDQLCLSTKLGVAMYLTKKQHKNVDFLTNLSMHCVLADRGFDVAA